jgi:hypothetical protein
MIFKKGLQVLLVFLFLIVFVNATKTCNLEMTLLNQDPYPAVPGEEVKIMFQITGVQTTDCGRVSVYMNEKFPFTIAPNGENIKKIEAGTFLRGYENFWMVPYTLRVNENALDGDNKAEFVLSSKDGNSQIIKEFNINVQEVATSFEVFVRNYEEGVLTLEVINIGKNNVESLVIEIPEQETLKILGSNRQTIGILDSNEDTTVRFRVSDVKKGKITININYNDLINNRRKIVKEVSFNLDVFKDINGKGKTSWSTYALSGLIVFLIINWFYKKHKTKKRKKFD